MPLFEFICKNCSHRFETLVQGSTAVVVCPACKSKKLERQLSVFAKPAKGDGFGDAEMPPACGTCGDPRGPGSCSLD